ncbi:MAG TPA: DegT/DnrJ/EryC1/StrS family aminotransferase [Bacteriovoracaceae bacterium]|nr:DegT/DnrJ/EryC1/StrS family aminotransferase [Bacteriovoracaceae bacterium]
MQAVGFYNFSKLHDQEFQKQVMGRFQEIVANNAFVEGKWNTEFESGFAKLQGAKHCLLLANGTDAIELALIAVGVKPGDKVGVQAISFYASAEAIVTVGAIPVFIDVFPESGLMDPASLERVLKKHDLKAIIPVHIYGQPVDITTLEKICKPKGIKIIEDGAQSQGGFYENGKPIGSSDNITTFSFYPTKNLGAFGDAGAVTFNDDAIKQPLLSLRNHGRSPGGTLLVGRNSRCDHLQAAVLHLKLEKISQYNEDRKAIAAKYVKALKDLPIRMVPEKYLKTSSWHLFPIGVDTKETKYKLKDFLTQNGIGNALFYEKALPEEGPISHYEGEREKALLFAGQTLCLPMHPFLTDAEIDTVKQTLKKFF